MATIFNMYKDVASPDVTADIRASRRESEANTKKTQDTAFGMLKSSNIGTLQQQYRAGSGRFEGIADPDNKFQVYYDALKALDPQAAQDAAKVYAEERQRRINREIADAYKTKGSTGNAELDAIDQAIAALEQSITVSEAISTTQPPASEQAQPSSDADADDTQQDQGADVTDSSGRAISDYGYLNPSIDTGRLNQPIDTTLMPSKTQSDYSKLGTIPKPSNEKTVPDMTGYTTNRLAGYYSSDRVMPSFDVSLSRQGTLAQEPIDPRDIPAVGSGMEGYIPASRLDGYKPMTRNIANMYRGR